MALENRYDFVMLFDVETGTQWGPGCGKMRLVWMQSQGMDLLRMYA